MPNYYTTMMVCSPGWEFNAAAFNEQHKETDLCRVVKPIPEPLEDVSCGWCSDADGRTLNNWREVDGKPVAVDEAGLIAAHGHANWYDWAHANWGTKWGCCDMQAFELGGDSAPVLIKFQSAWSAPKILQEIAEWLKKRYTFERVVFIGFDPYDDSVRLLKEVKW